MKKFAKIFALAALMFVGGQAMAQTRGAMFLGASFPMKEFAQFDGVNSFALSSNGNEAGAGIGFNVGFKWYYNVGVKGLNVLLSLDGMYNGLNDEAKDFYKSRKSALDLLGSNVSTSTPKYINVPLMIGVNYILRLTPQFGIYAEAGLGGNARFITNYTEKYTDNLLNVRHTATVDFATKLGFAWQVGAGFEVARNLVIGCSFYNLGETAVKAEKTGDIISTPAPSDGSAIKPVMVLGRIGFCF